MSRHLNDLSDDFRPLVFEFLARLTEQGIGVLIVDTLRTSAEHEANLAKGVSWTALSKHLDGPLRGSPQPGSDAIDVVPFDTYLLDGADKLKWDSGDPIWDRIGKTGEAIGLRWGGRWKQRDMGHFELVRDNQGQPTFYKRAV
jgi:hypothetical protein